MNTNQTMQHDDTFEKIGMGLLFVFLGFLVVFLAGAKLATLVATAVRCTRRSGKPARPWSP
ncbi:MAG: hypothetical protein ACR2NA_06190 [Solirubrobacterales bacterium]